MKNGRILQRTETRPTTIGKLPIIGKIKIGDKAISKKTGKEYAISLEYFRATGPYASLFQHTYGERPTTLEIVFPDNDPMTVCREELEGRSKKNGKRYGFSYDAETYYLWDASEQDYLPYSLSDHREEIEQFTRQNQVEWKTTLFLNFILLKLPGVLGQWQLVTKGTRSSMPQITQVFDTMQESLGSIVNIPFDLQVEKVTSQKPGDTKTFSVVRLIPNISTHNIGTLRNYLQSHQRFMQLGTVLTDERIQQLTQEDAPLALKSGGAVITQDLAEHFQALTLQKVKEGVLSPEKIQEAVAICSTGVYHDKQGVEPLTDALLQQFIAKLERLQPKPETSPEPEPSNTFTPDPACQLDPDCQRYAWEVEQHGSDIMQAAMQDAVTAGDEDKIAEIYASHQTRLRQA